MDSSSDEDWSTRGWTATKDASKSNILSDALPKETKKQSASETASGKPLIIVDFTKLSEGKLHNRFDKHACNNPELKRKLSKEIESNYEVESRHLVNAEIAYRSGQNVWREALMVLRDENEGHFFAPIWPS